MVVFSPQLDGCAIIARGPMRFIWIALVILASAFLLVNSFFAAANVAGYGFYPSTPLDIVGMVVLGVLGLALQFVSAWLLRPAKTAELTVRTGLEGLGIRLFISFFWTVLLALFLFWLILGIAGV